MTSKEEKDSIEDLEDIVYFKDYKRIKNKEVVEYDYNCDEGYEKILLYSFQKQHFHNMITISSYSKHIFDLSRMGLGKTECAIKLCLVLDLPALIVSPVTCKDMWIERCEKYGLKTYGFISYASISGKKNSDLSHNLLVRKTVHKNNKTFIKFKPSTELMRIVKDGVVFIFDEAQELRNNTGKFKAVLAITKYINEVETVSKCLYLSGTLYCKKECSLNFSRYIGFIKSSKMYYTSRGQLSKKGYGLDEMIENCKKMDLEKTIDIVSQSPFTDKKRMKEISIDICHKLFTNVVCKYLHSSMPKPDYGYHLNICNLYIKLDDAATKEIKMRLRRLNDIIRMNGNLGGGNALAQMNNNLVMLDNAKSIVAADLATSILDNTLRQKCILITNFEQTLQIYKEHLSKYKGVVVNGKVNVGDRSGLIDKFNNDDKCRYSIFNRKVASFGINLHDQKGGRNRNSIVLPSWFVLEFIQSLIRIYRVGVKSDSKIFIINALIDGDNSLESKIIQSIIESTKNLRDIMNNNKSETIRLPEEYTQMFIDDSLENYYYD